MSENRDLMQAQATRIAELEEAVRRKQALAEERQELINTWQAEKEQALAELVASKQETGRIREALETAEKRMQGYEKQFAALQQAAAEAEELRQQLTAAGTETEGLRRQLAAAGAETDELRQQLAAAGAETDELRQQLGAAGAETDELRQQLKETIEKAARERGLIYRIRDKLDKQAESNNARH